jgi:hypothetical protein
MYTSYYLTVSDASLRSRIRSAAKECGSLFGAKGARCVLTTDNARGIWLMVGAAPAVHATDTLPFADAKRAWL